MYESYHWQSRQYTICHSALFFFFKQKTAYEMRISDWSSDVCSSDLVHARRGRPGRAGQRGRGRRPGAGRPNHRGRWRAAGQLRAAAEHQIGRTSCRERVCLEASISVGAEPFNKNIKTQNQLPTALKYNRKSLQSSSQDIKIQL